MKKKQAVLPFVLMLMLLAFTISPAGATPTIFSGVVHYCTYAPKTGEVLYDVDCPATAELTFLDGQEIALALTEGGVCGDRTIPLEGTMTPSGQLKLWYPDWLGVEEIIMGHTGCRFIAGVFPVYHGSFHGQSLVADTAFNCMIPEHWPPNDIFPTPVDGPAHFHWTIDLAVSP